MQATATATATATASTLGKRKRKGNCSDTDNTISLQDQVHLLKGKVRKLERMVQFLWNQQDVVPIMESDSDSDSDSEHEDCATDKTNDADPAVEQDETETSGAGADPVHTTNVVSTDKSNDADPAVEQEETSGAGADPVQELGTVSTDTAHDALEKNYSAPNTTKDIARLDRSKSLGDLMSNELDCLPFLPNGNMATNDGALRDLGFLHVRYEMIAGELRALRTADIEKARNPDINPKCLKMDELLHSLSMYTEACLGDYRSVNTGFFIASGVLHCVFDLTPLPGDRVSFAVLTWFAAAN